MLVGPMHGYGIARWVEDTAWGLSENNRRARHHTITAAGRKHLCDEAAGWLRYAEALTQVLRAAPALA
jgi:hypothetical protein